MQFMSMSDIVRTLGHESRSLTILKMDCEGCEWDILSDLGRNQKSFLERTRMVFLEFHVVSKHDKSSIERARELAKRAAAVGGEYISP